MRRRLLWSGTNFSRSVESNLFLLLLTSARIRIVFFHLLGAKKLFSSYVRRLIHVDIDRLMPASLMTLIHLRFRKEFPPSSNDLLACLPPPPNNPVMSIDYFVAVTLSHRQKGKCFRSLPSPNSCWHRCFECEIDLAGSSLDMSEGLEKRE